MSGGVALEEAEIPLEANGQTSWFIEDTFTTTDTSDFLGSVRCTAPGRGRFTAIAVGDGCQPPHLYDPAVVSCGSGRRWPGGGPGLCAFRQRGRHHL